VPSLAVIFFLLAEPSSRSFYYKVHRKSIP
jgi:hypothetical protein